MIELSKDVETILESIDGFLLIDANERIVFMCKGLLDTVGVESLEHVRGRRLRDVIASNNTYRVLETGQRQIGVTYLVQGHTIVSNGYPIYKDGKLIGALEYDVFEDADLLQDFFEQISTKKGLTHFSNVLNMRKRRKYSMDNIKGSSNIVKKLKNEIKMASRSNSTVLISGETGTGKELIARAIHLGGQRSIFEFVEVNCATIPGELFESELFGYEEGSFTGAKKGGKKGLAQLADKGTLFLDEVNALPMHMQAKLLRFLQEKEIQQVGGGKPIPVDVRILAATNQDLSELVQKGLFRQDLYYRLNIIQIVAEPLRKRRSDIPELVNSFIDDLNLSLGRTLERQYIRSIDNDVLKILIDHDWPGNVRELRNAVERAMNRCSEQTLTLEHFTDLYPERKQSIEHLPFYENGQSMKLRDLKRNAEITAIDYLICKQNLSIREAAEKLGISRQMLHRKLKEYGISAAKR